jgi:hypothetical protein
MSDEKLMTEKESMELITSMINKAKNNFGERGLLYLIWGWVILFCCITNFIGIYFYNYTNIYFVWLIVYLVIIFQIFYLRKLRKARRTKTYTSEINAFVWIVFFICMILMIFICNVFKKYEIINPLLLVLYGMPTFLSGIIIKFKPLIIGAICCWILSAASPFINIDFQLILIATAVIVAWIIPGYLLKAKFKKEN